MRVVSSELSSISLILGLSAIAPPCEAAVAYIDLRPSASEGFSISFITSSISFHLSGSSSLSLSSSFSIASTYRASSAVSTSISTFSFSEAGVSSLSARSLLILSMSILCRTFGISFIQAILRSGSSRLRSSLPISSCRKTASAGPSVLPLRSAFSASSSPSSGGGGPARSASYSFFSSSFPSFSK